MFGHNSFNVTAPYKSEGGCEIIEEDWNKWTDCGETSQQFRNKYIFGDSSCADQIAKRGEEIITSLQEKGFSVNGSGYHEDGRFKFGIGQQRPCTTSSEESEEPEEITGCMRVDAINYNPDATIGDDSCEYATRSLPTTTNSDPVETKTQEPVVETKSETPYLSIIAFLAASGVLGNGIIHHYQITDRIKSLIAKYK